MTQAPAYIDPNNRKHVQIHNQFLEKAVAAGVGGANDGAEDYGYSGRIEDLQEIIGESRRAQSVSVSEPTPLRSRMLPEQADPAAAQDDVREFNLSPKRKRALLYTNDGREWEAKMMPFTMERLDEFWYMQGEVSRKGDALQRLDRRMDPKGWERARKRSEQAKFDLVCFAFPNLSPVEWKEIWAHLHPSYYLELIQMVEDEGRSALGTKKTEDDDESPLD